VSRKRRDARTRFAARAEGLQSRLLSFVPSEKDVECGPCRGRRRSTTRRPIPVGPAPRRTGRAARRGRGRRRGTRGAPHRRRPRCPRPAWPRAAPPGGAAAADGGDDQREARAGIVRGGQCPVHRHGSLHGRYCLSQTATPSTGFPCAFVFVTVIVFPSLDTTAVSVRMTFPSTLWTSLTVLASRRVSATTAPT
jgi:hypothetical protein